MRRLFQALIGVIVVATACGFAFLGIAERYPGAIWLMSDLSYVSPLCPDWKIVLDSKLQLQSEETGAEIKAASSIIEKDGNLDLWSTPKGRYWVPTGNEDILSILLAQQEHDVYGKGDWGVQPGDVVLDCGAHVGVFAKKALAVGASKVVAIEPSKDALECLRRNLADEIASGKAIIYPKGVWDSETTLQFFENVPGSAGNSFVLKGSNAKLVGEAPVTTIDRIVGELRLGSVDMIKMDVKGATERALRGAEGTIREHRPRLALSTEELGDDPIAIEASAKRFVSDYERKAGPCVAHGGAVFTDVLFLR